MLHWKTGYNPYVADRYLTLCLETLIPSLSDVEAVMDETLLAATVVLRMLEEMDGKFSSLPRPPLSNQTPTTQSTSPAPTRKDT